MNTIFLGGVFEKQKIDEIMKKSKSGIQFAADALQWNIIEGLDYWNNNPITIINVPFVGAYPRLYKDLYLKHSRWSHVPNANDYNVGFINLKGIKNISRAFNSSNIIKKCISNNEKNTVIAYSFNASFLWAIRQAKLTNKHTTTVLIVPDLPQHMNLNSKVNFFYNIAKRIEITLLNYLIKYVDAFVLLTKSMATALNIEDKAYCVVEGMINRNDILEINQQNISNKHKSILYTGTLNYKYGIKTLLDAFKEIEDESYELWICGYGEAEEHIKELSEMDHRIKWFGAVNREQALRLQQTATTLINPRQPGEEFTKYSFPSKNLEYLLSGRPVIGYKLPGIPDEYDKHIFYINGNSIKNMAETIVKVCELSKEEQDNFGEQARNFVLEHKNNLVQTKKIIEMINNL